LLERLWNGDFAFRVKSAGSNTENMALDIFEASHKASSDTRIFLVHVTKLVANQSEPFGFVPSRVTNCNPDCYDYLYSALSGADREVLLVRLLHHIFRQTGYPFARLEVFYGDRRCWKSLLDLAMCRFDAQDFANGDAMTRGMECDNLGRTLEACGEFVTAARVYLEGAKLDPTLHHKFYELAGQALLTACKYEEAEEAIHVALRGYVQDVAGGELDFDSVDIERTVKVLLFTPPLQSCHDW